MRPPRLELDHIAAPRRRHWPGWLVLAVSLAAAADLALDYRDTAVALERVRAGSIVARPALIEEASVVAFSPEQEAAARAAVRQLTLPWASLIAALEAASIPDVALLQLQPEAREQVIRVTAEARNPAAMFRYLRGLGAERVFSEVHLVSHEVIEQDPQRPVRFSAQASFRGMR